MNNNNPDIEKVLSKISFRKLSNEEQSHVWDTIVVAQNKPLSFIFNQKIMFKSIIVALILVVGIGGTVAMADNSVPGDPLFGIERAVENLRITLASKEKKDDLRVAFAGERIREVEHITTTSPSMVRPTALDVTESTVSRIEADVFTNETVVKIEYSTSKKFVFTSNAKTRVLVVEDIIKNFGALSKTFVEAKLDFQIEDRASRAEDKNIVNDLSSKDKARVSIGINAAIALLNGMSVSADTNSVLRLKSITDELNRYLGTLPPDSTVDIRVDSDDDKSRIDLRTVDGRVRVEIKDGEIKIKTNNNSSLDSRKGSSRDDDDESDGDDSNGKSDDDSDDDRDDDSDKNKEDDDDESDDGDDDKRGGVRLPPIATTPSATAYTLAEVKLHNTQANCWTTVNGSVYNVTSWIAQHPGGSSTIIGMCGVDASSAFNGQHGGQSRPASELASFKIGILK